jgi:hypothetical protein
MCSHGSIRGVLDKLAPRFLALVPRYGELTGDQLERVHALLGYLGCAYVRVSGKSSLDVLPVFLAKGWVRVSDMLQRRPMLDYADCVLFNWERLDPAGPISMDNIRLLHRFTGVVDEEHFFKTHIILESEAALVIEALLEGAEAFRRGDTDTLLEKLSLLESGIILLHHNRYNIVREVLQWCYDGEYGHTAGETVTTRVR